MKHCGSIKTMGQGSNAICGEVFWQSVYQCDKCKLADLTSGWKDIEKELPPESGYYLFSTDKGVVASGFISDYALTLKHPTANIKRRHKQITAWDYLPKAFDKEQGNE